MGCSIFYDVERRGSVLPEGPVLITANHPNALIDPLVVFQTAGRPSRPLQRPHFSILIVGTPSGHSGDYQSPESKMIRS
ncbi:MAG: hypothetical protein Ct9H300mP15_15620 [Gemmatimonadota bacterium]|nr:MAG: hypothetical protein Ct9H300mP15_15620 [Gemmatimonadota bacterium]